jgi:hypothetical protein
MTTHRPPTSEPYPKSDGDYWFGRRQLLAGWKKPKKLRFAVSLQILQNRPAINAEIELQPHKVKY